MHLYTRKRKSRPETVENYFQDKHKLRVPEDVSACWSEPSQPRQNASFSGRETCFDLTGASFHLPFVSFSIFKIPSEDSEMDHCHLFPLFADHFERLNDVQIAAGLARQTEWKTLQLTPKYAFLCCASVVAGPRGRSAQKKWRVLHEEVSPSGAVPQCNRKIAFYVAD